MKGDGPRHKGYGGYTCEEIAQELGISPARVMQIEQNALRKLRRACARLGLNLDALSSR